MPRSSLLLLTVVLALSTGGCSVMELLGGDGNVFELGVGDCFNDDGSDGQVSDVPIVDCSEPHDNEVFHTFEVADGEYPGDDALQTQAEEQCIPAFEEYVGIEYASSRLDVFPITPTEGSWSEGDREVICALYDLELAELEGSMQGSEA